MNSLGFYLPAGVTVLCIYFSCRLLAHLLGTGTAFATFTRGGAHCVACGTSNYARPVKNMNMFF